MRQTSSVSQAEVTSRLYAGMVACTPTQRQWIQTVLIEPRWIVLNWEYGGNEPHVAWLFAELGERNVYAAYCIGGFGALGSPWGLVFGDSTTFGQDSAWYESLAALVSDWHG